MLFKRIVAEQAFPLELKVPNAETRAAMEKAREMMRARRFHFRHARRHVRRA
jgi:DNA-damage-inducible protein J